MRGNPKQKQHRKRRKHRKGRGKAKGGSFERQVAKDIVRAFRKFGIKQRECWRSTLSGGHAISAGDLAMSDRLIALFPYAVECKWYKKVHWEHFLLPGWERTMEGKWWLQALEGAKKSDRPTTALLVIKENRTKTIALQYHKFEWRVRLWKEFLRERAADAWYQHACQEAKASA